MPPVRSSGPPPEQLLAASKSTADESPRTRRLGERMRPWVGVACGSSWMGGSDIRGFAFSLPVVSGAAIRARRRACARKHLPRGEPTQPRRRPARGPRAREDPFFRASPSSSRGATGRPGRARLDWSPTSPIPPAVWVSAASGTCAASDAKPRPGTRARPPTAQPRAPTRRTPLPHPRRSPRAARHLRGAIAWWHMRC